MSTTPVSVAYDIRHLMDVFAVPYTLATGRDWVELDHIRITLNVKIVERATPSILHVTAPRAQHEIAVPGKDGAVSVYYEYSHPQNHTMEVALTAIRHWLRYQYDKLIQSSRKNPDETLRRLERITQAEPNNYEAWAQRILLAARSGEFDPYSFTSFSAWLGVINGTQLLQHIREAHGTLSSDQIGAHLQRVLMALVGHASVYVSNPGSEWTTDHGPVYIPDFDEQDKVVFLSDLFLAIIHDNEISDYPNGSGLRPVTDFETPIYCLYQEIYHPGGYWDPPDWDIEECARYSSIEDVSMYVLNRYLEERAQVLADERYADEYED